MRSQQTKFTIDDKTGQPTHHKRTAWADVVLERRLSAAQLVERHTRKSIALDEPALNCLVELHIVSPLERRQLRVKHLHSGVSSYSR